MIKYLLLTGLLTLGGGGVAHAQVWRNPLPIDSTTQQVTYTAVVQVPGASQAELYSRAREWFANTFGSAKAVLEMDDREAGKLIGRAYAQFDFAGTIGRPLPWALWRRIKVEVKEGRYRYTFSNFELGGPIATPASASHPLEQWIERASGSRKEPGRMVQSVIDGIEATGKAEAGSLQAAMSKKAGGDF